MFFVDERDHVAVPTFYKRGYSLGDVLIRQGMEAMVNTFEDVVLEFFS
mgnify:CR=1 FL=1